MTAVRVLEYLDSSGRSPWRRWFNDLDAIAAAKAGTALYRLGQGNFSTVAGGGGGGGGKRGLRGKDRFRTGLQDLLRQGRRDGGDTAGRQHEEAPERRNRVGAQGVGRLQAAQEGRCIGAGVALTREFKETVVARARRDARFRDAM